MKRNWVRLAAIVLAAALVAMGSLASLRAFGKEPPGSARNDAEWIQMIRDAKSGASSTLPPPPVQEGDKLVYDCRDIPLTATPSQEAYESSSDGTNGRALFFFVDFAANPVGDKYTLVVPWDAPEQTCANDTITRLVNGSRGVERNRTAVAESQRYLCEQMQLNADGKDKTDPTLPPASPAVAKEYLKAFCQ